MSVNYAYNYAEIDPDTNMCVGIYTGTHPSEDPNWVEVPTYSDDYCFKYYDWDTQKWYYDAEMTNEWIPPEA